MDRQNFIEDSDITLIIKIRITPESSVSTITGLRATVLGLLNPC